MPKEKPHKKLGKPRQKLKISAYIHLTFLKKNTMFYEWTNT